MLCIKIADITIPKEGFIILITISSAYVHMNNNVSCGLISCTLLLVVALLVIPVCGADANAPATVPAGITAVSQKQTVSAMVSVAAPTVGEPVTISGAVSGGKPVSSVQIWIFAGSYVNVSTAPVNSDGTYSKTYQTAGLPPATYYVFVQTPGDDGAFNVKLENTGTFSGQAVDAKTGALLVNFTGTGSVQNAAAAVALSDSLNRQGVDDVYTKTTFQLVAPASTTAAPIQTTPAPATSAQPTKSPLSPVTILAGLGLCGIALVRLSRK